MQPARCQPAANLEPQGGLDINPGTSVRPAGRSTAAGAPAQAKRTGALEEKLDAAVKAGTLTQAEADAGSKAADLGVISVGPR